MIPVTTYTQLVKAFARTEALPDSYCDDVQAFLPQLLADMHLLFERKDAQNALCVVGINGSQGSGKSTLGSLLVTLLQAAGLNTVSLSLDDFYLDSTARSHLAKTVHPLLRTRGVPGTHDIELACATVNDLRTLAAGQTMGLPRFDKSSDEPMPAEKWDEVCGPVQVLILEGWFLACPPQAAAALNAPINSLEREEDQQGSWRHWVNSQLAGDYQILFAELDYLLYLRAPSMEQVIEWRQKQEQKLRQALTPGKANKALTDEEVVRFVSHFERLTRHCIDALPERANWVLELDAHHRWQALKRGGAALG